MKNVKYITQITSEDLKKVADVANISVGQYLRLTRSSDGLKIEINEEQLKVAMYAFYHNGGFNQQTSVAASVVPLVPPY